MKKPVLYFSVLLSLLIVHTNNTFTQTQTVEEQMVVAIDEGNIEKVKELLKNGVNPNLEFHSRTPLMFSIWKEQYEIFKFLIENGADYTKTSENIGPLINLAAAMESEKICEHLLQLGADIESKDREGKTPLMIAVYSKHPEIAKFFIEKGADVNAQEPNGWTALFFAAMHGDIKSVNYLIEAKADVNLKNNDGESPLDRAKLLKHTEVINALTAAGAK